MIVALCGGVGGSKLALGLYRTLPTDELTVIVNTADDLQFCGLHVSPDLDTVTYTLAGLAPEDVGWGIAGDTRAALEMLQRYGVPAWFQVGDRDLATDIVRTDMLRRGLTLTDVATHIAAALDVRATVLPMTDAPVATRLLVDGEWLDFQEYFVHRRHAVPVEAVRYDGVETAAASEAVQNALGAAEAIIFVNSNPVLSILPILEVGGINDLIASSAVPRVAVSPIVGNAAVAGPAGDLMRLIGQPASVEGVANAYLGLIDGLVVDTQDSASVPALERQGLSVLTTSTVMRSVADRERLASETLEFARGMR